MGHGPFEIADFSPAPNLFTPRHYNRNTMEKILREILTSRVYEVARETTLDIAPRLSKRLENTVWLKREDQQPIFSFKIRGAYNRIARLSQSERAIGVITAS